MDNINISTWNVHGKGSPEEIDKMLALSFESKVEQQTPHIVCVQQANLPSSGVELQNYKWLCFGKFGSAVLINKASTLKAGCFEPVCEQICVAEVVTDLGVVVKVISCYMPPSTDYATRDLWPKLVEVVKRIPVNVIYVLAGDFNAEIGKEDGCPSDRGLIGPKLYHKNSNENGMQLKNLAFNFHATVATTFGVREQLPFYTFKDGEEKSQRSFIIVPSDRVPYPSKILLQECKYSWHPNYKSAVLSKSLRFTLYEKLSNLISSPVIVSCWNVRGASPSAVDKALSDLDLPVVCVQDVFLTSDDDVKTNNYTWFTSKKLWGKNIGILIKSCSNISMADFEVVCESLCVGNITVNGCQIKVISCSLPPHTDSVRFQEVAAKLLDLVKNIPEGTVFIIAGEFNTLATYTILDFTLVFEDGDENALFLQKLMKECNVELSYTHKSSVTQVSKKSRRNSSLVLMSLSCMMKYSHRCIVRWVPFFENGVVTMYLPESEVELDRFLLNPANSELAKEKWNSGKVEHVDGFMYKTKTFCRMKRYLSIGTTEQQAYKFIFPELVAKLKKYEKSDLPDEIVMKYKTSPPPLDELLRILGDGFTLYHGFLQESTLLKGCASVLTASLEYLNRRPLLAECIDVFEEKTKEPVKRIIKFRWNGIVVHQQEGGKFMNYKRIINKGQSDFISTLGQHCFTVKAKASFYNNGLPPLCQDKDKLSKVMRVIKREEFPPAATMEDVKLRINAFFTENPQYELVFGPDFSYQKFLGPIKKYVVNNNLMLRIFKSRKDLEHYDHISIFAILNPQELRKILVATPEHQDLRFQLIPPSGTDKDYFDWVNQWTEKTIPDEYYKPYEKSMTEPEPGIVPSSGGTEEHTKPANLEGSKTQKKKHSVGFVHKAVRSVGNQMQHRITRCTNLMSGNSTVWMPKGRKDWVQTAREESDLPQDFVDKYRENPLPVQELSRVLGDDFTLYYGFGRVSCVVSATVEILAESFEAMDRGGIMLEMTEVLKRQEPCSRIVKFKWNGVCIHQEEGSVSESFKNISQKGQTALIDKLGQNYYAVRAKMSYFYKGTLPLCQDKEKLTSVLRMVEISEFPQEFQLEDVKDYIRDFFSKDSDVELVFGPEFSLREILEPLRKFSTDKEFGYRLLKMTEDAKNWDSVSIFIKRSPLEVRDRLMQVPDHQDLRFFLVPPCEFFNKSHYEWIKSWAAENFIEEFKLISEEEEKKPKTPVVPQNQRTKPTPAPQNRKRPQTDNGRGNARSQPTRSAGRSQQSRQQADYRSDSLWPLLSKSAGQTQQVWQQDNSYRENTNSQLSKTAGKTQQVWQQDNSYRENTNSQLSKTAGKTQQVWQQDNSYRENTNSQLSKTAGKTQQVWQQDNSYRENTNSQLSKTAGRKRDWKQMDFYGENSLTQPSGTDYYRENSLSQPSGTEYYRENSLSQPSGADYYGENSLSQPSGTDYYRENSLSQPSGADYYGENSLSQPSGTDYYRENSLSQPSGTDYYRENSLSQPSGTDYYRENSRSQVLGSDDYTISHSGDQGRNQAPERYVPESKRARERTSYRVDRPRWDDMGPLVIVWPISIRSEEERNPRIVLEANFPTEVSLEANNKVTVHVTLPLRNRRDKKYCLCVGDGVYNTSKTALDMLVKRSSVIKNTATFLPPDGLVPNFIRYNIPCQTNPRTYILLSWMDTGSLTKEKIIELFNSFKCSLNEDLFFDRFYYSHEMKQMLLDLAPKHGLKVRHFGTDHKLVDRYVCVYKTKPKEEVLEEVLKMRDLHPKYKLVSNKLPPRLGLNIF